MHRRLAVSLFRYTVSLIFALAIGLGFFVWWAVGDQLPTFSKLDTVADNNAVIPAAKNTFSIASYNIGHGQGVKEQAWDHRDKATTEKQLNMIANAMSKMDADIFLLQEVDLDSNRTYRIDQIEFIKKRTGHAFHACATVWEKNYVPFPFWPPAHHIGYVRAANCVLSRFPLKNHQRIIFDKPESYPFWYNWGYIDRGIERVDVQIGDKTIALLNVHFEAWETQAREKQIQETKKYMDSIHTPIILAGDFNTVLPDAPKKDGFLDDPDAHFDKDSTFTWFFKHAPEMYAIAPKSKNNNPFDLYTFPSNMPDRRLDHIYISKASLSFLEFRVVKEAELASDHLPVYARIKFSKL
ncbi:MAG: endonuclease/exonuclease/phosphatase family protein [Myxococcales bacterium]|nr:endonuclease/exonuclease/phosphatase family protein [Myxococcales bacterium]USN50036.1 MAG: endonuclease/exonuclease/phosphatase family protein [Myxococcales bacterium]